MRWELSESEVLFLSHDIKELNDTLEAMKETGIEKTV